MRTTTRIVTDMKNATQAPRITGTYSTVAQGMSSDTYYSDLFGANVHESGAGQSPPEGFYVLDVKPWLLQVQEERDGAWHMVYTARFFRKADALTDAERQGIVPDYVSHHHDRVRGVAIA